MHGAPHRPNQNKEKTEDDVRQTGCVRQENLKPHRSARTIIQRDGKVLDGAATVTVNTCKTP
eukprot:463687-Pelagomonas_calceolata.AAC.3